MIKIILMINKLANRDVVKDLSFEDKDKDL